MLVKNTGKKCLGFGALALLPDATGELPEGYGADHPVVKFYLGKKWLVEVKGKGGQKPAADLPPNDPPPNIPPADPPPNVPPVNTPPEMTDAEKAAALAAFNANTGDGADGEGDDGSGTGDPGDGSGAEHNDDGGEKFNGLPLNEKISAVKKMNLAPLRARAEKLGIAYTEADTKAVLAGKIIEKLTEMG